jgi:hypothetical protein
LAPRHRSELYRLAVGLIAVAVLVATVRRMPSAGADWWLIAALAVAGILALEFPLHVNLSEKVSVATAVFFAAVLLLPIWQAAALVGALQAADICLAAFRKVRATRERPPLRAVGINIVFNGGQAYLSTLAAGLVLSSGGVSARASLDLRTPWFSSPPRSRCTSPTSSSSPWPSGWRPHATHSHFS